MTIGDKPRLPFVAEADRLFVEADGRAPTLLVVFGLVCLKVPQRVAVQNQEGRLARSRCAIRLHL